MVETKKVRVYWNLHKNLFSVQDAKTRRVIAHVSTSIVLKDAEFRVSEPGRQRVLREKKKNVHAFICGTWVLGAFANPSSAKITYNPYKAPTFTLDGEPMLRAECAVLKVETQDVMGFVRRPIVTLGQNMTVDDLCAEIDRALYFKAE